jgi:hypothetical protein
MVQRLNMLRGKDIHTDGFPCMPEYLLADMPARAESRPALLVELLVAFSGRPEYRRREVFCKNGVVPVFLRHREPVAGSSGSIFLFPVVKE